MKTTSQIAAIVGSTPGLVRKIAAAHKIGMKITSRMKIFSEQEVTRMKRLMAVKKTGRPRISVK